MATAPHSPAYPGINFEPPARWRAALVTACFFAVFYKVFLDLSYKWIHDDNWSHGWIIPLFSVWFLYHNWEKVRGMPVRGAWLGLPIMLAGIGLFQWSLWGLKFGYLQPLSMMICLLGIIILLCGVPVMRYAWISWAYLFFAIPLPGRLYSEVTNPMRRLAAQVAAPVLSTIPGLVVERSNLVLEYMYKGTFGRIGVEDACSGMRGTITLLALGVAVTFMSNRPTWQRLIMLPMCIPIALLCNVMRVLITCMLFIFVDAKYASGPYHGALGMLMLLIAFGLFSGLGWILNNLMVEEPEPARPAAKSG